VEVRLWGDHILSILGFNLVHREILSSFGGNPKAQRDTYNMTNSKFIKPIKILAFSRGESKDRYGTMINHMDGLIPVHGTTYW